MTLEVAHINKAIGGRQVLRDLSFSLGGGEAMALLGANGAGKTTLLRIVTLLIAPDSGSVLFDGHPMVQADLAHVGYLPEERGLYRHMRAMEQAVYLCRLKGMSRADAERSLHSWFARLGMEGWERRQAASLSKGMQQRLQLAVAVAHNPSLLILDEPFSGFDEQNADMLKTLIGELRNEGTAILLSTHNTQAALDLCGKTTRL